jgi:hypothetical protein
LAQLIFDLHQINPKAQVSVKLVAEMALELLRLGSLKQTLILSDFWSRWRYGSIAFKFD